MAALPGSLRLGGMSVSSEVRAEVEARAQAAAQAAPALAAASDEILDAVLQTIAARLESEAAPLLAANEADMAAARGSLSDAMLDRLRLGAERLAAMAGQVRALAHLPPAPRGNGVVARPDGAEVEERCIPVGVIGANYEARANVTVDVATQLVKSRNGGVLRTGGAAIRTATAMIERVVAPALAAHGLPAEAIDVVRDPDRDAAYALVALPALIPLVILRGSGPSTAALAQAAARNGVRTLAHADGGGVLFVERGADPGRALALVEASLDRLGVCNRLNLLLVDEPLWEPFTPAAVERLTALGVAASLPPHDHALGYEWANDDARAATVTIAPAAGVAAAARIANEQTSGLAAGIATEDAAAAEAFLDAYRGTGGFWNVPTRLLDGFKLLQAPETGINLDRVPGPRGPVTYRDLHLRQYVVRPRGG